jgi:hypothetical protein
MDWQIRSQATSTHARIGWLLWPRSAESVLQLPAHKAERRQGGGDEADQWVPHDGEIEPWPTRSGTKRNGDRHPGPARRHARVADGSCESGDGKRWATVRVSPPNSNFCPFLLFFMFSFLFCLLSSFQIPI